MSGGLYLWARHQVTTLRAENTRLESERDVANNKLIGCAVKIAELERHIRHIETPQFHVGESNGYAPQSWHCNHCDFKSPKILAREKHVKSCVKREEYLSGETKEQGDD